MERFKLLPKSKIDNLPKTAGVYCFTEKVAEDRLPLIYIGKAINIQNRVKNHFNQPSYRDNLFMDKVDRVGYLETGSEIEALILEANLIKKYQPRFNVVWKDGKNYFYVAISKDEKPIVYITHQKNETAEYIGPFVEGTALKKTLRFLRKAFPYYTSKKHPKLKCTYCHLGLCPGPEPDLKEYKKNIKKLALILKGKRGAVLNSLKREMKTLSKEKSFEEAGKIRDKIYNLEQIMAHTHVLETAKVGATSDVAPTLGKIIGIDKTIHRIECYDVSNIQGKFATGSMVSAGIPLGSGPASGWVFDKSQYKKFKIKMANEPNDIAMLKETISRRLNHPEWKYPEVMLIDGGVGQLNVATKTKNRESLSRNIKVISIAKGKKELFIEGKKDPIPLKNLPQEVYNIIKQLDDEAHRFAITYHEKLRKKNLLK